VKIESPRIEVRIHRHVSTVFNHRLLARARLELNLTQACGFGLFTKRFDELA